MARLTDGKKIVDITMQVWAYEQYSPDWSNDFFAVGRLKYDDLHDAYVVKDVDYCIEEALNWKYGEGDFAEGECDPNDRMVSVYEEALVREAAPEQDDVFEPELD